MPLGAARIKDEEGRRPLHAETLERLGLLLRVRPGRDEILGDEGRDVGVGVDLGFQPSACPSHRGGGEVEEQRPAGLARLTKRCVDISMPIDFHGGLLGFQRAGASLLPSGYLTEQQSTCRRVRETSFRARMPCRGRVPGATRETS